MTMTLGIVGAGAVAHALCAAWAHPSDSDESSAAPGSVDRIMVWARRPEAAASVVRLGNGRAVVARDMADLQSCDAVIVAVSDAAIEIVGELLVEAFAKDGPLPRAVFHTGGSRTGEDALAGLKTTSAALGSLHPLVAVAGDGPPSPDHFVGMPFAVESTDPAAVALGRQLVRITGGFELRLPAASTPTEARREKMRYHALATMVATGVVTLVDRAAASMGSVDSSGSDGTAETEVRASFRRAYGALAQSAVANVLRERGADVLTGAIARGDDALVEQHLGALGSDREADLYRAIEIAAREMLGEDTK